jgi:hypothetical protein
MVPDRHDPSKENAEQALQIVSYTPCVTGKSIDQVSPPRWDSFGIIQRDRVNRNLLELKDCTRASVTDIR